VVKITIQLEDIFKGEKFKFQVMKTLHEEGLFLQEKHAGLYSEEMPKINNLTKSQLLIKYKNKIHPILIQNIKAEVIRAGLSHLFGYGIIKYNYELPIFKQLDEKSIKQYMKLAVEIWERNIHIDWMKSKGYLTHNGTKDSIFLHGMISDDWKSKKQAIEKHRERSEQREKGDTPHHIFRDSKILKRIIEREGNHELTRYLIESVYDQATATTRIWYPKRHLPFEKRIIENRDEGYFLGYNEKGQVQRWKPGFFGFTNDYENKIWNIWCKAHEEFKNYWINKFGKKEEFWQPPAPLDSLN